MHDQLINAIIYLAAALIAVPLFEKLRLGAILGYLAAGIAIGPWGAGLVANPSDTLHLAELGVVLLLFLIGLELSPETLWRMRNWIMLLGGAQLMGTAAIILTALVLAMAMQISVGWMIGLAVALSSTAFAIQLMSNYHILNTSLGQKGFAILLFQDLAVIPILLYVEALSGSGDTGGGWWIGALAIVGVLIVGRFLINPLLRLLSGFSSSELMTAAALLIVLGTALLIEAAGLSMGMGAFIAGILLANSSFKHQLETEIDPFKGLLLGLFFIAIGMTLDMGLLLASPLMIVALAVGLILIKTLIIAGLAKAAGASFNDAVRLGIMLSQGGEFAFVVMTHAASGGVVAPEIATVVTLVVGLSMAMTSPLLVLYNKLVASRQAPQASYDSEWAENEPEVLIAGFGRVGQITGRILAANNIPFTALDKNAEHIEFVRKFGSKVFFGDATRLDLLEVAGIRHATVVLIAVDDEEQALEIAELVRAECPHIKIVSRAHNRVNLLKQHKAGVDYSVREMFGSSVSMAAAVLRSIGMSDDKAREMTTLFTRHDDALIEEALKRPIAIDQLIEVGLKGRAELEELFARDKGDFS